MNTESESERITRVFNQAPAHENMDLESRHVKEVMLHAVTKFELEKFREALKAAILLAECGEVANQQTVEIWGSLL